MGNPVIEGSKLTYDFFKEYATDFTLGHFEWGTVRKLDIWQENAAKFKYDPCTFKPGETIELEPILNLTHNSAIIMDK